MRKIKGYKDFEPINESVGFGNSEEYEELKRNFSKKDKEEIKEYFYEVTDDNIMDLRTWSYIGETETGRSIGFSQSSIDTGKNHSVFYIVELKSKNKSLDLLNLYNSTDNLRKVSNNLKKVADTVDTFRSAFSEDLTEDNVWGTGNEISAKFIIRGESINAHIFDTYYKKWKSNFGKNYEEGLNRLISEYQKNNIQDPPLDTNDTDENDVLIGCMLESEVIVVAFYDKRNDDFDIDWPEFRRSVEEYEIERQQQE